MKYRNAKITLHHALRDIDTYQVFLTVGVASYIAEFQGDPDVVALHNLHIYEMGKDFIYDYDWVVGMPDITMRASMSFIHKIITVIHMEFAFLNEDKEEGIQYA